MKRLVLLLCVTFCNTAHFPPSFKKCKKSVPDFNQCLSKAVADAIHQLSEPEKELGIPSLEPLEIPSLVIGAGHSAVQFDQHYKDLKVSGLTKPSRVKVDMDFGKNVLILDVDIPDLRLDFQYEINGKILVLPITGKGPGFVHLSDLNWLLTFVLEKYDKKGKPYLKVSKTSLHIVPQGAEFNLENLFNGDKTLADNVIQVMNDNWRAIYDDISASYEDVFAQIFTSIFNKVLEKIPASELFED